MSVSFSAAPSHFNCSRKLILRADKLSTKCLLDRCYDVVNYAAHLTTTIDIAQFRSDDKRRLRLLEEELRMAKEATVRLHDDLMRAEERRQRHQDDLDRVKNTLNESESRRLCLQNQYDSAQTEVRPLTCI